MSSQPMVLLVANESELLETVGFTLNHRGYHVVQSHSGDGAVALCDLQLPDIAVVDMLLPGMSGFLLTRLLKERSDGKVLVVMISELSAPAHRDYALAAGVDLFLEKWLAPTRLAPLVEQLCPLPSGERHPGSGSIPQTATAPV